MWWSKRQKDSRSCDNNWDFADRMRLDCKFGRWIHFLFWFSACQLVEAQLYECTQVFEFVFTYLQSSKKVWRGSQCKSNMYSQCYPHHHFHFCGICICRTKKWKYSFVVESFKSMKRSTNVILTQHDIKIKTHPFTINHMGISLSTGHFSRKMAPMMIWAKVRRPSAIAKIT